MNFAGIVLFGTLSLFAAFGLVFFSTQTETQARYNYSELFIVSSSIALSSSTVVSETLHAAHLKESAWGGSLLRLVAIQDLIMIPLLALPEILHKILHYDQR